MLQKGHLGVRSQRMLACWVVAAAAFATGCDSPAASPGDKVDAGGTDGAAQSALTWHRDIHPIVARACLGCHAEGGIGPFRLDSPKTMLDLKPIVLAAIDQGRMPPWGAMDTKDCAPPLPWLGDLRLSADDRQAIRSWLDAGAPEGDPKDAKAPVTAAELKLAKVDRALTPSPPYTVTGTKDQYVCFVLDPKLEADSWLRGIHFRAGNPKVAHHALLFADESGAAAAKGGAGQRYPCFGGPGVNAKLIAAWAPGGVPVEFPKDAGLPLKKASRLVLQMHYHPIGVDAADATTVELEFAPGRPNWTATSDLIGNYPGPIGGGDGLLPGPGDDGKTEFLIPAGAKGHEETMVWTVPPFNGAPIGGLRVYGVATHMHYVGRDMRIWIERDQKAGLCGADTRAKLGDCVAKACQGKLGEALIGCAVAGCGKEVQATPQPCTQCLATAASAGAGPMWDICAPVPASADAPDTCLLHTPNWDFAWQRFYFYDAPVEQLPMVGTGDRLWMKCIYDNSLDNQGLAQALNEAGKVNPRAVRLGEETLDEMCLAALYLLHPTPPEK